MPYFMRHYSQFANVILLESCSTDRTIEIASSFGATIWKYDVPDEINDEWITKLKNNCWKDSRADWVMIVDADEFIYHPNITEILRKTDAMIIRPKFWNMY
jgi:glycosyltransferase involved in cell wall biosynthesis